MGTAPWIFWSSIDPILQIFFQKFRKSNMYIILGIISILWLGIAKKNTIPTMFYLCTVFWDGLYFIVLSFNILRIRLHLSKVPTYTDLVTLFETFIIHMLLLKNPQFLPNDYETRWKLTTHEYLILTEFLNHWVKIVDFLIKACVL